MFIPRIKLFTVYVDIPLMTQSYFKSNQGMGMAGAILFTGVIGVMGAVAAQKFKGQYLSQNATEVEISKTSITNYIFNAIDCEASQGINKNPTSTVGIAGSTSSSSSATSLCIAPNTPVELKSRLAPNATLIKRFSANQYQPWSLGSPDIAANSLTTLGQFYIAATCNADGDIQIYIKKIKGLPKNFINLNPSTPWRCGLK
jgi:hypothetical protein